MIPIAARYKTARMMLERNKKALKYSPPPPPSADADPLPLPPPPQPLSIVTADPDWYLSTFCKSGFVLNKSQNVSTRRSWKSTTILRKLLWKPFRLSFMQIVWRQSALSCRFLKSFFAIYQWCQLQRCAPCFDPYKTSLSYSSSTLSNLSKLAWQFIVRFLKGSGKNP